jgi:hypothetical protein
MEWAKVPIETCNKVARTTRFCLQKTNSSQFQRETPVN